MRFLPYPKQTGFTLLELSVVLIIIALVAGGIVVGQSLIRSATLRSVMGEYDHYLKAVQEFQDKYLALPGDMPNAEEFWDKDISGADYNVIRRKTINGNGDGRIGTADNATANASSDPSVGLSNETEWFRAWQQLANAGFIDGAYSGVHPSYDDNEAHIGFNVPGSAMRRAGWTLYYYLHTSTNGTLWGDHYGHLLEFGSELGGSYTRGSIITPAEAYEIDSKLDDGKPGRGKVRVFTPNDINCTTNNTSQDNSIYNTTYTQNACSPIFLLGF